MIFKLRTSKDTMNIFEEVGASLHLQPFVLVKIALSLSLANDNKLCDNDFITDSEGLELNRQTITGEYDLLFKLLAIQKEEHYINDDDYFPRILKAHIDRGAKLLYIEFKYNTNNFYEYIVRIDKGI